MADFEKLFCQLEFRNGYINLRRSSQELKLLVYTPYSGFFKASKSGQGKRSSLLVWVGVMISSLGAIGPAS